MIKVNEKVIEQNHFPDHTLFIKSNPFNLSHFSAPLVITWEYENDSELFTLICAKRHYDAYCQEIWLRIPYLPHARQDRVKHDEDVFTLKYFCEVINYLNFRRVYTKDIHSNVALGMLNNVHNIDSLTEIQLVYGALDENVVPFFPDEGAMKRYSEAFSGIPYSFGLKKRNWETGKIKGLEIVNKELVKGRDVLIIDDICSRGGTFYHSAKALKEAGVNDIYLFVSHLEDTVFSGEMYTSGLIKKIFTLNTIYRHENNDFIEVVERIM